MQEWHPLHRKWWGFQRGKALAGSAPQQPLRAIWNSVIAGIIYEHMSIESLRRELKRNRKLRQVRGSETGHKIFACLRQGMMLILAHSGWAWQKNQKILDF